MLYLCCEERRARSLGSRSPICDFHKSRGALDSRKGGQRQDIRIPGNGRSNGAKGTLKFDKQPGFCIGGTEGSPKDGKLVYSDQCRTGYKVKLVGDAPPGPPPNCGRKCSSDSDCQTGGFVQYPTCYVNSGTMCHGYCGP